MKNYSESFRNENKEILDEKNKINKKKLMKFTWQITAGILLLAAGIIMFVYSGESFLTNIKQETAKCWEDALTRTILIIILMFFIAMIVFLVWALRKTAEIKISKKISEEMKDVAQVFEATIIQDIYAILINKFPALNEFSRDTTEKNEFKKFLKPHMRISVEPNGYISIGDLIFEHWSENKRISYNKEGNIYLLNRIVWNNFKGEFTFHWDVMMPGESKMGKYKETHAPEE